MRDDSDMRNNCKTRIIAHAEVPVIPSICSKIKLSFKPTEFQVIQLIFRIYPNMYTLQFKHESLYKIKSMELHCH